VKASEVLEAAAIHIRRYGHTKQGASPALVTWEDVTATDWELAE
jgi:hypothetical protein